MSAMKRIESFGISILMILASLLLILDPTDGYGVVIAILGISLTLMGIRYLIYYFTMAKHMVGGKLILVEGIIIFDAGLFACTLTNDPKLYVMVYLILYNIVVGVIEILSAKESLNSGASWKGKFLHGIINIGIAIMCIMFNKEPRAVTYIYSAGLLYSAARRVINALKPSAMVYIQ